MATSTEAKDDIIKNLKATDWLRLPLTCFLFGMMAGALVIAVLVIIFIC